MKRCCLCGASSTSAYCHAHSWAAGGKTQPERTTAMPPKATRPPPALKLELVAGPSTGSGRRLIAKRPH